MKVEVVERGASARVGVVEFFGTPVPHAGRIARMTGGEEEHLVISYRTEPENLLSTRELFAIAAALLSNVTEGEIGGRRWTLSVPLARSGACERNC